MNKVEVKAASSEDLIMELVQMATSSRILKSHETTAKHICRELSDRGVVDDADSLFKRWDKLYTF